VRWSNWSIKIFKWDVIIVQKYWFVSTKSNLCVKELSRLDKIFRISVNHDYDSISFISHDDFVTYLHYMNDVFFDYLNEFVSIYINDILIYSNFKKKHVKHFKKMLQRLRNADFQADIDKCEFFVHETKYLDLIVRRDEIRMNSEKIETILQWATSQNLK
jgi:hypothetical protein